MTATETTPLQTSPHEAGLPVEVVRRASRRKLLLDLSGALALLLLFNFASVWFLDYYSSNYGYWVVKNKWRMLLNADAPVDLLILGDSSANQGVMPSVIEQESGLTSLNLGTIGNMTLVDNLWMLEAYIERFGPPEKVVMVHVYDMWHRRFDPYLVSMVPMPLGFWTEYTLSEELMDGVTRQDIFKERFFPPLSQVRTLRNILYTSITALRNPFRPGFSLDSEGYFPSHQPLPERVVLGARDHIQFTGENAFMLSYSNEIVMEELIRLAEEEGFDIYLVNGPLYEGLYEHAAFQEYMEDLHERLEAYDQDSPRLHYIREVKTFPAEQMQTPDHLITDGAVEYTQWLVDILR